MKFFSQSFTYSHPWHQVTFASWRKYPNPQSSHVLRADVIEQKIDEEGNLVTLRVLECKQGLPTWVQKLVSGEKMYFLEESKVNPVTKKHSLRTVNITYGSILRMNESCSYQAHAEDADRTVFEQEASIEALPFGFANYKVEQFCIGRFQQNAARGKEIMEAVIQKVKEEVDWARNLSLGSPTNVPASA